MSPYKRPFDRAAHCRKIGSLGGHSTVVRHGVWHMKAIGSVGKAVTIERHGLAYWKGVTKAKGYTAPQRRNLARDLIAGKAMIDQAAAAASAVRYADYFPGGDRHCAVA